MTKRYLFLFGGAIGDSLLGIHVGRLLAASNPGARLVLLTTRTNPFVRDLAAELPFVEYRELCKEKPQTWVRLFSLFFLSWHTIDYDPFNNPLSYWWRLILWCARIGGGIEVHCQIRSQPLPQRAVRVLYDCKSDSMFKVAERAVGAWGVPVQALQPSLTAARCMPASKPYIVFHFFAGAVRRSIPVDHGRALLTAARVRWPEHEFVLTCGPGEAAQAQRIADGFAHTRVVPAPSAQELMCLLAQADLSVGTASGVIHLASHLTDKVVALCNLSDPCWLPHYNPGVILLSARGRCKCNGDKTGDCGIETPEGLVYACLFDIQTDEVIAAMQQKLP